MDQTLLPRDIYQFLAGRTLGQEDVLKRVSVAVYKHINGFKAGNLLLIGGSGTGKTTIMNSIQKFYAEYEHLKRFKVMTIMNANMFMGEGAGDVNLGRLLKSLELAVNNTFGSYITDVKLKEYMENATVCIDEVDKIPTHVSGKANVSGISIQHALLTLIEGERVLLDTVRGPMGQEKKTRVTVDTSRMLFLCGGAFEGLYDQVTNLIRAGKDSRQLRAFTFTTPGGVTRTEQRLVLKDQIKLSDLFDYGMAPQFISRFKSIAVLEDLGFEELKQIMLTADDSPLRFSITYFSSMGIDLRLTKDALDLIAAHAMENTRIGARALSEAFTKVIDIFEYDPLATGKVVAAEGSKTLTIDRNAVLRALS